MYPPLLIRTHYSFLSSTVTVRDVIDFASLNGCQYAVLCENNTFCSCTEFFKLALNKKLIPVLGIQLLRGGAEWLFFAKNLKGYHNLIKIFNNTKLKNDYLKGVIVVHMDGEVILKELGLNEDQYNQMIKSDDFYDVHSQPNHGLNVRDIKFSSEEDFINFCALRAINNNTSLHDEEMIQHPFQNDYLFNHPDNKNFNNSKSMKKLLESCQSYNPFIHKPLCSDGNSDKFNTLQQMAKTRLLDITKGMNIEKKKIYTDRLQYELEIIQSKGFSDYFLIVQDMVRYCEEQQILVGPGRGSSSGSLLSYSLNITKVNPIKYGLFFERFLNPHRVQIPDIDIDVESERREELIGYLIQKYGHTHVAHTSTIHRFKWKSAFKAIGKILNISEDKLSLFSSFISPKPSLYLQWIRLLKTYKNSHQTLDFNAEDLSDINPSFTEMYQHYHHFFDLSISLIDVPHSFSTNPAGIILSSQDVRKYPIAECKGRNIQLEITKNNVNDYGLVKFDILSLTNLSLMKSVLKKIEPKHGIINLLDIPLNCPNAFKLLSKGCTAGVFQLEKFILSKKALKCFDKFQDVVNLLAIIRPGVSKKATNFLKRRIKLEKPTPLHPKLQDITKDTFGVVIFQEQVLQIVSRILGVTLGEADVFRDAISKKKIGVIASLKEQFIQSSEGYSPEEIQIIWGVVGDFCLYGLNKSHAAAYAMITYWNIWLKANHGFEYFLSLFEVYGLRGDYLDEFESLYGALRYPCLFTSQKNFVIDGRYVRAPLRFIHGIDHDIEDELLRIRDSLPNKSCEVIVELLKENISIDSIRSLISAGALDVTFQAGESRNFLNHNLLNIQQHTNTIDEGGNHIFSFVLQPAKEFSVQEDIDVAEMHVGFKETHPIPDETFERLKCKRLYYLFDCGDECSDFLVIPHSIKTATTKHGHLMWWIKLLDGRHVSGPIAYFGNQIELLKNSMEEEMIIKVTIGFNGCRPVIKRAHNLKELILKS